MRAFLRRWPLLLPVLVLLSLFLYMTGPGLGGTSDSVRYLWAAHTLRDSGHLLDPDGTPYRFWGPLYPVLLAGFFSPDGVRALHGGALLAQLVLWARMGRWLLPPGRAAVLPWLLALSAAVLVPAKFIWSEPVFGALAAAYFYALLVWGRSGRNSWLVLATVAGFLLPLQRTSGFFLLAGAGVGLLITGQWRRGRWLPLLGHWVGCAAGGLAWNYYAELVAGPPVYQALRGWAALGSFVADYGFVLARWFLPLAASWLAAWPLLWALALPVLLLVLWPKRDRQEKLQPFEVLEEAPKATSSQSLRLLWWVVALTLVALLAATNATRAAAGPHDAERYCAVLVGPVLVLALARWPSSKARWWGWFGRALVVGWLLYSAGRVGSNAHRLREYPPVVWPKE